MKKILVLGIFVLMVQVHYSLAEEKMFPDLEHTVGFIKTDKGDKYIVIETESGAKLVRTEKDPQEVIQKKLGIDKEDLNLQ